MLTGRPPFRAPSTLAVLKRVTEDTPRPIQEIIPEVPDWMCALVGHLHAKQPDERYGSAKEVSKLLATCLADFEQGRLPNIPAPRRAIEHSNAPAEKVSVAEKYRPRAAHWAARWPVLRIAAVVLVVLFVGLGISEATGVSRLTSTVIRLATGSGTLVIETDDPDLKIAIDGEEVTIRGGGIAQLTLRPGPHKVAAMKNGKPWKEELVTITRNGRKTVQMSLEPAPAIASSARTKSGDGWYGWPKVAPPPAIVPFDAEQAKRHQQAWAKYLGVPVEYENSIGMKFRLIPPGEFLMGSTPEEIEAHLQLDPTWRERIESASPQHGVILTRPIYLGVTEVTQSQFEQMMGFNPSAFSATGERKDVVADLETKNHPAETVSWIDAAEFCAKLNQHEALKPFDVRAGETVTPLEGTGYRLPTEAEWEFACRAGTTTRFWSGDWESDLRRVGWFRDNSGGRTHAVGELTENPFGLYDVHGNVWEWVQDSWDPKFYGKFADNSAIDPICRFSAVSRRSVRGGVLGNAALGCRSSTRHAYPQISRRSQVGFRVVLAADASKLKPIAKQEPLPPTFTSSIGMDFVIVPKGKSWLGGGPDKLGDKEVEIPADFYLGKYEVTQEEWEKVMAENPSHFSRTGDGKDAVKDINDADLKRFPVEMVSWDQCQVFVAKLNKLEKEAGWVYRLPTDVEWEYACRGSPLADKADSAFDFYFAQPTNTLSPKQANFGGEKGLNRTCKVGSYQPNALGLCEMHGNVAEWCANNIQGADGAWYLRLKGGGFANPQSFRAGLKAWARPSTRARSNGLRLARVPSGVPSPAVDSAGPLTAWGEIATRLTDHWSLEEMIRLGPEVDRLVAKGDASQSNVGQFHQLSLCFARGADWPRATTLLELSLKRMETFWRWADRYQVAVAVGDWAAVRRSRDQIVRLANLYPDEQHSNSAAAKFLSEIETNEQHLTNCREIEKRLAEKWPDEVGPLSARACVRLAVGDIEGCRELLNQIPEDAGNQPFRFSVTLVQARSAFQAGDRQPAAEKLATASGLLQSMYSSGDLGPYTGFQIAYFIALLRDAEIAVHGKAVTPQLTPQRLAELAAAAKATPFTDADAQRIAALPAAQQIAAVFAELRRRNPGFDDRSWKPAIEGGVVAGLSFSTSRVTDIRPLRALTQLRRLLMDGAGGKGGLTDLSPLTGMKLTWLELPYQKVSDLAPLRGMPLEVLHLWSWAGGDLTPLKGMPLKRLNVGGSQRDLDLTPLAGTATLEYLCLNLTNVSDLTPLENMRLTGFECAKTRVSDLTPLRDMRLELLTCEGSLVTDLSSLEGMPLKLLHCDLQQASRNAEVLRGIKTLEKINEKPAAEFWEDVEQKQAADQAWLKKVAALPADQQIEEVRQELIRRNPGFDGRLGISPNIDPATKIEDGVVTELRFVTDNVSDISPVRALAGLTHLWCQGSSRDAGQLADLSPLKGMSLESFSSMWNRKVADLSPLEGMPLTLLNVWGTNLANIEVVRKMPITALFVADTPVTDLSPLAEKSLAILTCEQSKVKTLQGLPAVAVQELHCDLAQLPDKAELARLGVTHINGKPVAEFFKEGGAIEPQAADAKPPTEAAPP